MEKTFSPQHACCENTWYLSDVPAKVPAAPAPPGGGRELAGGVAALSGPLLGPHPDLRCLVDANEGQGVRGQGRAERALGQPRGGADVGDKGRAPEFPTSESPGCRG